MEPDKKVRRQTTILGLSVNAESKEIMEGTAMHRHHAWLVALREDSNSDKLGHVDIVGVTDNIAKDLVNHFDARRGKVAAELEVLRIELKMQQATLEFREAQRAGKKWDRANETSGYWKEENDLHSGLWRTDRAVIEKRSELEALKRVRIYGPAAFRELEPIPRKWLANAHGSKGTGTISVGDQANEKFDASAIAGHLDTLENDKTFISVRATSCHSAEGVGHSLSFAERLDKALEKTGFMKRQVRGYRGRLSLHPGLDTRTYGGRKTLTDDGIWERAKDHRVDYGTK